MANVKISQLASASALSGSEVLPVVQAGATKKITAQAIADLAAGGSPLTLDIVADGTVTSMSQQLRPVNLGFITTASGNQSIEVKTVLEIYMGSGATATTITLPTLTIASLIVSGASNLVTFSLPVFAEAVNTGMAHFSVYNCSALTTINIPALTKVSSNTWLSFNGNALSQATVDNLLAKFVATGATNNSLSLDGGTNATPSSAGLADKAILVSRGWTVNHN
jgi:hypothetical protein